MNYSEFIAATLSSVEFSKEDRLLSAFRYFDTSDSGYITLDSVIDALKQNNILINETGLGQIFTDLEKVGKKINFEEFKKIFFANNPNQTLM